MKKQRSLAALLGLSAVMVIANLSVVGTASAQTGAGANSITIRAQDCCDSGQVVVDAVVAAEDGWLAIYKNPGGSSSDLLGYAPVHRGQNTRFTVDVNSRKAESASALWAALLADRGEVGLFEPDIDGPAPNSPMVAFATSAAGQQPTPKVTPARAPIGAQTGAGPNQIIIKAQDCCNSGQVVVDAVVAAEDGWLGIYKNPGGSSNNLLGYAPVRRGQNARFTVDVNSGKAEDVTTLWAMLLVDRGEIGVFEPDVDGPAPNSPMVAFATSAAGQ